MPTAFVQIDPTLLHACAEQLVVTANERLRRELVRAFDAEQQRCGRRAWPSANVWSLQGLLIEQYRQLADQDPSLPQLLSTDAQRLLFQTSAPPNLDALSELAMQAWQLAHEWQIPLDPESPALSATENGRAFAQWADRVNRALTSAHAVTQAQLPGLLSRAASPAPPQLLCLGFETTPVAISDWLSSLQDRGSAIGHHSPDRTPRCTPVRCDFASPAEELNTMAQWARQILDAAVDGADVRIGIVIPGLAGRYQEVERQFSAELNPDGTAAVATEFDIAGGMPLGGEPIWRTARDLLELCLVQLPSERLQPLFHSPFLALDPPTQLSPKLPADVTLWELIKIHHDPLLSELNRLCPPADSRDTLSEWLVLFERLLDHAGLRGSGTQSTQYQAWEQIRRCLLGLRTASEQAPRCTAEDALLHLQRILDGHTFAPETPAAPLQIMGYLETTGLQFSHLWVGGLEDTNWPTAPTPNPFIPLTTQRTAGVPRVDHDSELRFASSRIAQWRTCSNTLILSHAREVADSKHGPSPLINSLARVTAEALVAQRLARSHPFLLSRPGWREEISDESGSRVPAGPHRGGTSLLRDQALCPFRGWAITRLGLREQRAPHTFPDALDRGILIHEALRLLLSTQDSAPAHPDTLTDADIAAAADNALRLSYERFPDAFLVNERERLERLLHAWLQLETTRGEFSVVGLETQTELEVGGLRLQIRLDRLDETTDGLVVIDYKTGRVNTRGLLGERLVDPQLPAYAISQDGIHAVLFAQLDATRPRLVGLADNASPHPAIRTEALPEGGWDTLQRRWRTQLSDIAMEFRAGYAAVLPTSTDVCQRCHLQPLCRVGEE